MALQVGSEAPDFELRSHRGGTVKLSDFRGKRQVVLAFHPLAFTPVCATQMCGYESDLGKLEAANAAVLGISVDAQPAKAAWAKSLGPISFDLLSDFHPHGDEHDNGQIWSATLWDVRNALGRAHADRVILESHFQLDGFTTFDRGARAIVDADRNLHDGAHEAVLKQIFRRRKSGSV